MDGPRMMRFMSAAPPGSHHFSALLLKLSGRREKQSAEKEKVPAEFGWTGTFRRIVSIQAVISRALTLISLFLLLPHQR